MIVSTLGYYGYFGRLSVISVTRDLKVILVSMGSMFILPTRVIRAKVITVLICFMFIERMLT